MPSVQSGGRPGTVYSQPIYFAYDDDLDATVTTDLFQERGMRLGGELRYQHRKYSGFELSAETIRDRLWLEEGEGRAALGGAACERPELSPEQKQQCLNNTDVPSNTWRGKRQWRGNFILLPRLTLVSRGTIVSDHRYYDDLSVIDTFSETSDESFANIYHQAGVGTHYDGKDLYIGASNGYADDVRQNQQYEGYQVPLSLTMRSRYFDIAPRFLGFPLYASVGVKNVQISQWNDDDLLDRPRLGDGSWRQGIATVSSPLLKDQIINASWFAEGEARQIAHEGLAADNSQIKSWRMGLNLNLPIDGQAALPSFWQIDDGSGNKRFLHHIMTWGIGLSTRPYVSRSGPYGERLTGEGKPQLVYFASDFKEKDSLVDNAATTESSMYIHKKVNFSTTHRWRIFTRAWELKESAQDDLGELSYRERARRELEVQKDKWEKMTAYELYGDENALGWFNVRDFNGSEPVVFKANSSFDFEMERRRREARREGLTTLPEPWEGPNTKLTISLAGLGLTNEVDYNIYKRTSTRTLFGVTLPSLLRTKLSFGYELKKKVTREDTDFQLTKTWTKKIGIDSQIIPRVRLLATLEKQTEEARPPDKFQTRVGFEYLDSSECWGLKFQRYKSFDPEDDTIYLAQLSVIFFGQERGVDMTTPVTRDVLDKEGS
jgi:hypothetical protein